MSKDRAFSSRRREMALPMQQACVRRSTTALVPDMSCPYHGEWLVVLLSGVHPTANFAPMARLSPVGLQRMGHPSEAHVHAHCQLRCELEIKAKGWREIIGSQVVRCFRSAGDG
jgi:hypothetical protein